MKNALLSESNSFASVPKEILKLIFSFLDPKSLFQTTFVCRFWNETQQDETLWNFHLLNLKYDPHVPIQVNTTLNQLHISKREQLLMELFLKHYNPVSILKRELNNEEEGRVYAAKMQKMFQFGFEDINKKVYLDFRHQKSQSLLTLAVAIPHGIKIVEMLINNGIELNFQDLINNTALHRACLKNKPKYIEMLLNAGAKVNLQNNYGSTPIFIAAARGYETCVEILLQYGADPLIPNNNRRDALTEALNNKHQKCLDLMNKFLNKII